MLNIVMVSEYDEMATMQMFADEAREDAIIEILFRMIDKGLDDESIADYLNVPKEYVMNERAKKDGMKN